MRTRQQGLTLLELMIAVSVLAVLAGIAAPSFRDFTNNTRVTTTSNDLITSLNLARSEALKRGVPVTVCASANAAACGLATDWVSGWIVFQSSGAAGVIESSEDIVQKWTSAAGNIQLIASSAYLQYRPTGVVTTAGAFDVSYKNCSGLRRRHVQVTASGAVATQLQPCP
jgi:type IV fimbrial biogenesis protein FimT